MDGNVAIGACGLLNRKQMATKKYRRIRTIVNKIQETSLKCNLQMVFYVWEPEKARLREIYTHNHFKQSEINNQIDIF